jgi:hypothetical protein
MSIVNSRVTSASIRECSVAAVSEALRKAKVSPAQVADTPEGEIVSIEWEATHILSDTHKIFNERPQ